MTNKFTVGINEAGTRHSVTVMAEDALLAALKVKLEPGKFTITRGQQTIVEATRDKTPARPGATPLTLTSGANSTASSRIRPTTACFEAVYNTPPPPELSPATEAVKIIEPPVLRSSGSAARTPRMQPLTLTPNNSS